MNRNELKRLALESQKKKLEAALIDVQIREQQLPLQRQKLTGDLERVEAALAELDEAEHQAEAN